MSMYAMGPAVMAIWIEIQVSYLPQLGSPALANTYGIQHVF